MKTLQRLVLVSLAASCGTLNNAVQLTSVSLAQDCGAADAAAPERYAGDCSGQAGCGGLCRQSSMQLSFSVGDGSRVEIAEVRLFDAQSRVLIEKLTPKNPKLWSVDRYAPWNQQLPLGNFSPKVSYDLSAPNYQLFQQVTGRSPWKASYFIEVDVVVNGVVQTVSTTATREPEVVS
jgi:hypothetical protein